MSFSSEVKDELSVLVSSARHCQIAEITAIITMCGGISISVSDRLTLRIHTENLYVVRKYGLLLRKTFHIIPEVSVRVGAEGARSRIYTAAVSGHDDALRILRAAHLITDDMDIEENLSQENNLILRRACCRRCFLRGAFLVSGSVSDPRKSYHFEIVCNFAEKAGQLKELMKEFELDAKTVTRKGHEVVYLKEGAQIVDMLNVMEAHRALMDLENIRILREISNSVNRKVNCETANIHKTVNTAVRQIEDIRYLQEHMDLELLPEPLRQMAHVRLELSDAPLGELGKYLSPPIGKSGVNHRLRRLSELAERMRGAQAPSGTDSRPEV